MYIVSECVACFVVSIGISAFLVTLFGLLLTIKDGLENRRDTSPVFRKSSTLFGTRLVPVLARVKESRR